jgi:hypothetical protein
MTEQIYVSRNAVLVAGIAAVLTFLALVWVARTGDRARAHDSKLSSQERQVASAPAVLQPSTAHSTPASLPLVDYWKPPPAEFVKLTAAVSVYNSRGKEVKQFPVGKRLRVSKRAGNEVTINYLGDEYTIPKASTEPSQ